MRPGGSTANFSVPRPPSARPAPPRPKTALFQDKEESTFRPTTAKVQNVLLDEDEEADDENYIVHEVAAAPEQASGELETAVSKKETIYCECSYCVRLTVSE